MAEATPAEIQTALYGRKKGGRIRVAPAEERTAEGIVFASKREMLEWRNFKILEKAGTFTNVRRQVRYPLHAVDPAGNKVKITEYRADIVCEDREGRTCIYDPKGQRTERYKLIRKWFEIEYSPLRIVEL